MPPRVYLPSEVAEILRTSVAQVYALLRKGDLVGFKIGGRGQWRVSEPELESYIARTTQTTRDWVAEHPFGSDDDMSEARSG